MTTNQKKRSKATLITADPQALKAMIMGVFAGAGCGADEAEVIADHLVEANLAGHDSHGVIRTPIYLQWMRDSKVFAGRSLKVLVDNDTLVVVDGQLGFGQWTGKQSVEIGIQRCRQHGLALVALRNCSHLGRIGTWAEMAAEAGLVSLHFVNTSGLGMFVVPFGGRDARLSVNPVCAGIPMEGQRPIILDIAAATTAEGKLKVARNKGVPVPENTIVDADGNPTTDANDFYGDKGGFPVGAILPMGGHRGYGLCLIAELLAGALTGSGCSEAGKERLEQGMLSMYIDPARLGDTGPIYEEVSRFADWVRSSRAVDPAKPVLIPGEIEEQIRAERRQGLELDETTWSQIVDAARSCGVGDHLIGAAVLS
ncbi:MAG: malate/lactate/ureidoglycolate dehydrogenase [Candidatus Latescibacterota bacterium]|nr:malate/lactate/ureidoglycolate dehydrogenase [Candidatus Latescibacterota bacterium]